MDKEPDRPGASRRWGAERRLEFIEFRLYWEGRINRADLMDYFGISAPQASADLSRYQDMAPGNLVYDTRKKTYLISDEFEARFAVDDPGRYLSQLQLVSRGIAREEESWIAKFPSFSVLPIPQRSISPRTLRRLITAIKAQDALEIHYQSMSKQEPTWRWISPHAIGFDGFRWHARALCHNDQTFKDFVFARMLDVGEGKPYAIDPSEDEAWTKTIDVFIELHPDLSSDQKKAIELDYGMKKGKRTISVRRAFLYYLLKRLGLDVHSRRKRPQDQQIVLANEKEIRAALGSSLPGE